MTSTDRPVVERTGVLAGDPALLRERDAALGALTSVRADALCPLLRAAAVGDAHALTHQLPAEAVDLASLRERAPLRPGHVVTVLVAVLEALDALHRAHLAHGGVAADRVLVAPDGTVVLAGCGLAWSVPPGEPGGPEPAADVADVAALARRLLGPGSAPPSLVVALLRAGDPDPAVRPDAVDLAASVAAALPAEPLLDLLWLVGPDAAAPARRTQPPAEGLAAPLEPKPFAVRSAAATASPRALRGSAVRASRSVTRRRSRRATAGVALVAAALPLAAWAALRLPPPAEAGGGPAAAASRASAAASARAAVSQAASVAASAPAAAPASTPAPATAATASPAGVDWADVLARLDDLRARALAAGSSSMLAEAVDPSGPSWVADAALAARVRLAGARVTGGALVRLSVEVLAATDAGVRLRVRDVRTAYDVVQGGSTQRVAARPARTWEVRLVPAGGGWRIGAVQPVDGSGGRAAASDQ